MTDAPVNLRPLAYDDLGRVAQWLAQPYVSQWWDGPTEAAAVRVRYARRIAGEEPTEVFAIDVGEHPIGLIQRYLVDDHPEWARAIRATGLRGTPAGMDYLIGEPAAVGKGIGSAAIAAFVRLAFARYPQIDAVIAAPHQDNRASWRALERAGFTRIWAGSIVDDPGAVADGPDVIADELRNMADDSGAIAEPGTDSTPIYLYALRREELTQAGARRADRPEQAAVSG